MKCISGKVGLSIGLWFISEGVKKIGLDMVLPGDTFGDILMQGVNKCLRQEG